jgi:hypothetical protein
MIATPTMTTDILNALKAARGRTCGAQIDRAGGRLTALTTDGEVWASIDAAGDGFHDGSELFAAAVKPAPAMGPATFACTLNWRKLEQIVRGVVPATDTESSRYALGGVQIECREGSMLAAIGTDGRRLHVAHLQPLSIAGETPQYCVVPAAMWGRLATVARAAVRSVRSLTPRQAAEVLWRSVVTIETDGTVVRLTVSQGDLSVSMTARLIEGRFPRWRDIIGPNEGVGEGLVIDPETVLPEVADFAKRHRAAVAAGKAAWLAEPLPAGARRRKAGEYRHDRGLIVGREMMTGRGCDFRAVCPVTPATVCLDHDFLAEALEAGRLFGRTVTVRAEADARFGGQVRGPVMFEVNGAMGPSDGDYCGERFTAAVMPLAID